MSEPRPRPTCAPAPRLPGLAGVALGILVGSCLCASLLASLL
jgi:hypothetical protein